jgi:transitional endoplasmic reticulum ATPase
MLGFSNNNGSGDGLSPEDLQNFVADARTKVNELELQGNSTKAAQRRVATAIALWSIATRNSGRQQSVAQKQAVRWCEKELTEVNPSLFERLRKSGSDRGAADQTAGSGEDDIGKAEGAISQARSPRKSLDDLYGEELLNELEKVVKEIEVALSLDDHPAFQDRSVGNFLFTGRPGTGKTHAGEAVANALHERGQEFTFLPLKGSNLKSHLYGGSQETIERTFEWADENGPTLMFFDELEEIATRQGHEETQAITNTLLAATSGGEAYENVVVIGATNLPNQIDGALRQRFGGGEIEFTEPPAPVKPDILWNTLIGQGVTIRFERDDLGKLDYTGFVGRDLKNAAREAIVWAYAGSKPVTVTLQDVEHATRRVRPEDGVHQVADADQFTFQ